LPVKTVNKSFVCTDGSQINYFNFTYNAKFQVLSVSKIKKGFTVLTVKILLTPEALDWVKIAKKYYEVTLKVDLTIFHDSNIREIFESWNQKVILCFDYFYSMIEISLPFRWTQKYVKKINYSDNYFFHFEYHQRCIM